MSEKKISSFRLALVTGATSGIGEALCRLLADKGIDLIITGRNTLILHQLADDLRAQVNVAAYPVNLSHPEERKILIEKIHSFIPDLVINNAGFGLYGEALNYNTKEQLEIIQVNIEALTELSLEAARSMVTHQQQGIIVNISSAAAFQIFPCFTTYTASKAFVNAFSESFDQEMKPYGIRVLVACPGQVATQFRLRASQGKSSQKSSKTMSPSFAAKQIWKQILAKQPLRIFNWKYRLGTFLTTYLIPRRWIASFLRKKIESLSMRRPILKKEQKE